MARIDMYMYQYCSSQKRVSDLLLTFMNYWLCVMGALI